MLSEDNKKISGWCKILIQDEVAALLHSLTLSIIFVDKKTGEYLLSLKDKKITTQELSKTIGTEMVRALIKEKLIVSSECNEMGHLEFIRQKEKNAKKLNIMYLLLADGCNLNCKYCFEDAPINSPNFLSSLMSKDIANLAIDLFARITRLYGNNKKKRVIQLYGGEPLLNPEVARFSINKIDKLKKDGILPSDCKTVIITNGTLLDDSLINFFVDYGVSVGISIDGPEHINNLYRISKTGINVFDKAVGVYKKLKSSGAAVGLSVTLTPEVLENFDEALNFFIKLGVAGGLSFNIMHFNYGVPTSKSYYDKAAECLIRAYKKFRTLGIYEERMMRKVDAFINQEIIFADCGVTGSQIVVAPDGKIGVCQDFVKPRKYFGGSVYDTNYDPIEQGLFNGWAERSPLFMKKCYDCEAVAVCGGGCPASVEIQTGSRWNIDERICPHSKSSLNWLIWDTYKNIEQ